MATLSTSFRRPRRAHTRRFPLDRLGAAALIWAGGFMALAFGLVCWLG
jgi:hypothetical protein